MKKIGRSVHECRFRFVFVAEQYAFILMVGKQLPLLLKCSVARNFAKITKSLCLNFSIINWVYNTKLPDYTLPPTQQHRVFRNLTPSVSVCWLLVFSPSNRSRLNKRMPFRIQLVSHILYVLKSACLRAWPRYLWVNKLVTLTTKLCTLDHHRLDEGQST